jgi:gliding motility-associated lipoprotein GldD
MRKEIIFVLIILVGMILFSSCESDYTPKPKGYFRIELPEKEYKLWEDASCPYQFEIPIYSSMAAYRDSVNEPCWKYLRMGKFNAELFLSYKSVDDNLLSFIEDTRQLVYKHAVKADAIDEVFVQVPTENVYGIVYDIGGSAASSVQFFITDSTEHFIRGALYFNAPPQPDSLAPVIEFVRSDVMQLIKTTKWN